MRYRRCITIMGVTVLALALASPALAQRQGKKGGGGKPGGCSLAVETVPATVVFEGAIWNDPGAGIITGSMGRYLASAVDSDNSNLPTPVWVDLDFAGAIDPYISTWTYDPNTSNGELVCGMLGMIKNQPYDMRLTLQWYAQGAPWAGVAWGTPKGRNKPDRYWLNFTAAAGDPGHEVEGMRTGPYTWVLTSKPPATVFLTGPGDPGNVVDVYEMPFILTITRSSDGGCLDSTGSACN